MVICFSWEKQGQLLPKMSTDGLFSSCSPPPPPPCAGGQKKTLRYIFYHPRSTDFEENIEGLWTGYRLLDQEHLDSS